MAWRTWVRPRAVGSVECFLELLCQGVWWVGCSDNQEAVQPCQENSNVLYSLAIELGPMASGTRSSWNHPATAQGVQASGCSRCLDPPWPREMLPGALESNAQVCIPAVILVVKRAHA